MALNGPPQPAPDVALEPALGHAAKGDCEGAQADGSVEIGEAEGYPAQIINAASAFQEDPWATQPYRPEVWVWIEKEALLGVIEDVCNDYRDHAKSQFCFAGPLNQVPSDLDGVPVPRTVQKCRVPIPIQVRIGADLRPQNDDAVSALTLNGGSL